MSPLVFSSVATKVSGILYETILCCGQIFLCLIINYRRSFCCLITFPEHRTARFFITLFLFFFSHPQMVDIFDLRPWMLVTANRPAPHQKLNRAPTSPRLPPRWPPRHFCQHLYLVSPLPHLHSHLVAYQGSRLLCSRSQRPTFAQWMARTRHLSTLLN